MISKSHRFHGHGSLRYVYQHGDTVRGPLSALKFAPNKKRKDYRLAVVVSKKVSKSAVVRNRIRRRVYEAFRQQEPRITEAYDMVFTVFHEQLAEITHEELTKLVYTQLKQAGILNKKPKNNTTAK
jgi:ribonuclease P protein component